MKIVKVYKENMPHVKLVGKRYTNKDRDESGTFACYWQQCFSENWPELLWQDKNSVKVNDALVGAMRMFGENGEFEYWIGALLAHDAKILDGFESVDITSGELGVCWLYGNDKSGELYSMEASDMAMAALIEQGWKINEQGWFFERYNCPRFTVPDEDGNVILDICAYLI